VAIGEPVVDRAKPSRAISLRRDIEDNGACFIVRDSNGQTLSCVYYENEPGRRTAADLSIRDEARRIAINIAKRSISARARFYAIRPHIGQNFAQRLRVPPLPRTIDGQGCRRADPIAR
jgi:hypothetical protein